MRLNHYFSCTNQWRKTHTQVIEKQGRFVIGTVIMLFLRHGQKDKGSEMVGAGCHLEFRSRGIFRSLGQFVLGEMFISLRIKTLIYVKLTVMLVSL